MENQCYCCTCKPAQSFMDGEWDPACPRHGAHGKRGCERHGTKPQQCDCGCKYRVV